MNKYLKFIKKQKMPQLQLEDKKMPMTQVSKQKNSIRFTHSGDSHDVSAARTTDPLPSNEAVVYFQSYIKKLSPRSEIGVGIIQKDCALTKHPGQSIMSIGYLSSGQIFINGKKTTRVHEYKTGQTIGVGIIYSKQQVFFTQGSKLLQMIKFQYSSTTWSKFYPCIGLRSEGDHVEIKFRDFCFNYEELKSKIELQCIQQIQKQNIQKLNVYTLVGDFLKFHGYTKTFEQLKQNSNFQQLKCFVEHPFWESKIDIPSIEENAQTQEHNIENQQKNQLEQQDQLALYKRCSTRQRIMSDYWGDIQTNMQPRKRIYQHQRMLLQSRRKSSVISNFSNQDTDNKKKNMQQQEQKPNQTNQKNKFLTEIRIQILRLIREQNIQQAYQLLLKHIPKLFQVLDYLHAYFHMHIYLRTLKNDGTSKAMLYMRSQNEKFKNYKQQLYPIYCKQGNKVKFVPFVQMMGLISLKPGAESDALTKNQFYAFSNYVNQLILKNMGLYPQSRLDNLVNHLKCIGSKNQQYQINGLSFIWQI